MAGSKDAATVGIGFGTALAIAISWSANKSIIWAIMPGSRVRLGTATELTKN